MSENKILVFNLDDHEYGLYLANVDRVVQAVAVTPLPQAPDIVQGIINTYGTIRPVLKVRKRFRLPERPAEPDHCIILARTARRPVALEADSVAEVRELTGQETIDAGRELPYAGYVDGVVKTADGLILICDLDRFLALDEERSLDRALESFRQ